MRHSTDCRPRRAGLDRRSWHARAAGNSGADKDTGCCEEHGQLADDYDRALRYSLSVPGVSCALIGCASPQEVARAVRAARDFCPMTDEQVQDTLKVGQKLIRSRSSKAAMLREHYPADLWRSQPPGTVLT